MKQFLFILAILLVAVHLFAQLPTMNVYLNDGKLNQYNLSEIQDFKFLK